MLLTSKSFKTLILAAAVVMAAAPVLWAQGTEEASPGWLGVSIQDVTEELRETLPRGVQEGALINQVVEDSPAEAAGLKEGDVIVKVDQVRVRNSADLTDAIRASKAGQTTLIEYYREGRRLRTEAVLSEQEGIPSWTPRSGERRQARRNRATPEPNVYYFDDHGPGHFGMMTGATPRLGVQLFDLSAQLGEYFGVESGVLVTEVVEESAAETAGLKAGDVITAVGGEPMSSSREVREALGDVDSGPVEITILRHGKQQTLTAELKRARRSSLSGFHGPSAPMFNIPDVEFDQQELKAEMEQLREELKQLQKELSDMRGDSR